MKEETILRAVMEDRMFGALEVDLEVPDHLKGKFADMPPVFKNTDVSRDDIGDHMKTYAEERGIMNLTRKCLEVCLIHPEPGLLVHEASNLHG
jgi:hypothetical protein